MSQDELRCTEGDLAGVLATYFATGLRFQNEPAERADYHGIPDPMLYSHFYNY